MDMTQTYYRTMTLESVDAETQTVVAALSSETPVQRAFGAEVLRHDEDAIDFSRAAQGLPLLWSHNHDQVIGRVTDVALSGDSKLRGRFRFSQSARGQEVWQDVRDGILSDVSIGYRIEDYKEDDEQVTVTRWLPFEASLVAVPADASVGIGRSDTEAPSMPDTENKAPEVPADELTVVDFESVRERNLQEGQQAGVAVERKRVKEIHRIFNWGNYQGSDYQDLKTTCIEKGVSIERTKDLLLDLIGKRHGDEPVRIGSDYQQAEQSPGMSRSEYGYIQTGRDDYDKFHEAALNAILVRGKVESELLPQNPYAGYTLSELARESLRRQNAPHSGTREQIVGQAFTRTAVPSHGTGDFTYILRDAANKSLQIGYTEAPTTWQVWCGTSSIPDFKTNYRPVLSAFSDLSVVPESGEYTYGDVQDIEESYVIKTYGRLFSLSRQAIVNDDLNALTARPRAMGVAAARVPNDLAYGILTTNAALGQDSAALFVAGHSNFVDNGSGAAPSIATLDAGFTAMAKQTDPSGNAVLNISPAFLIVPKALEVTARLITTSVNDPNQVSTTVGGGGTRPNPFNGRLTVVADAILDSDDAAAWYLAASPTQVGTIEVGFLNGQQTPYLEQQDLFTVDGVSYKVRLDCGAKALDFRGLYFNDGN